MNDERLLSRLQHLRHAEYESVAAAVAKGEDVGELGLLTERGYIADTILDGLVLTKHGQATIDLLSEKYSRKRVQLSVRLSDAAKWKYKAELAGLSLSDWIKQQIEENDHE